MKKAFRLFSAILILFFTLVVPVFAAAPVLTGLQGLDTRRTGQDAYNNSQAIAGEVLVLYGSFAPNGNQVEINDSPAAVIYQDPVQINVRLTNSAGRIDVKVINAEGTSNVKSFLVVANTIVTPTPPPIETDLKGECAKQGLEYNDKTGLCLPANPYNAAEGSVARATSVGDLIKKILNILLTLGTVIAVLFIVIGGYQFITSRGSEDQAKAGRKTITYAVMGLAATLLAYMLVTVVTNLFTQGRLF